MEFESKGAAPIPGTIRSRRQTVERIEAYLRTRLDTPMRVSTLSRLAGISERGLREAFYSVHGMSPKQWILAERLKGVRRILTEGDSAPSSVTGAATSYGFYELGRFAATYREAFGEVPSATLRGAIRKSTESSTERRGHPDVSTS
jgi:AraC family transcriptional regulator, ethanolamine operon transcriptional activator